MKQTTIHYKTSNTLINRLKARDDIKILKREINENIMFI